MRFMKEGRRLVGWLCWLIVADFSYAIAWVHFDPSFFLALPEYVYVWLDSVFGANTMDESYFLSLFSTALVGIAVLHLAAWMVLRVASMVPRVGDILSRSRKRLFPAVGWTCWVIVAALVVAYAGEGWYLAAGYKLPGTPRAFAVEFLCGVAAVGVAHFVVHEVRRSRSR
jgi:hypothetical protein